MGTTIRHELPLLTTGQAQKDVTHNEALLAIDRQLCLTVTSRGASLPPPLPIADERHIVGPDAAGPWAGRSDAIARRDGAGWSFWVPVQGALAWIIDERQFAVFDGGWSSAWPVRGLDIDGRQVLAGMPVAIAPPSEGSVIDSEARTALAAVMTALRDQGILL